MHLEVEVISDIGDFIVLYSDVGNAGKMTAVKGMVN